MYKSVSSLCKHTCDAITEQKPLLTAINKQLIDHGQHLDDQRQQIELQRQQMELQHQQLEDNRQQTELLRQQNQVLIQQVTNLTLSVNSLTQDDFDDNSDSDDKNINQYLANTFGNRAVEESKEVDHPEDQPSSTSSSLSGDTLIAPCATASISTYI